MWKPLHADQVAGKEFSLSFRGFDQSEVRAFLAHVAAELSARDERERTLLERIGELETVSPPELDDATLEEALGHAATKVIHAAREAATEIRTRADAEATARLQEADAILAKSTNEAAEATAAIRAEVEDALSALRDDTEHRATAIMEESRTKAAGMIVDATTARDRVLDDLADLHAARDRLTAAYDALRRALDVALGDVTSAGDAATSVLARAREDHVPTPAMPDDVDSAPEPIEWDLTVVAVTPTATDDVDAGIDEVETPEPEAADDERRSSALKLVRRGDARGTPVAPSVDDGHEGVRIIEPEELEAAESFEAGREPFEPAGAAEPDTDAEPEPEPEPVVDREQPPTPERQPEPEPAVAHDEAPVDGLFARLRADRAEVVAKAEAVLAVTEPSPAEPATATVADVPAAALSPDLALLAARDDAVADAERGLLRSMKRAIADEQNEVLDALRRLRATPSVGGLLPDVAVHDARYDAVLSGGAASAASAGGSVAGGDGGTGAKVAAELGRSVAEDLRARVERAIDDAGGDVETLAEAISSAYREWKTARVEPLARDVITAAYAAGVYAAAAGELRWVVDPAEGGCPDCDDNTLAGPTPKGDAFPTGQLHPPAHAGCRCTIVPAS
jgi:DivIVA domain-containing protein